MRKGYADTCDGQVHFRYRQGTGIPVIFLHQTASSGAMWEKVIARWLGPHPLFAFDTPGFGASFDPEIKPAMRDYARWIVEAMSELGISHAHLAGHHTGSGIALQISHDFTDRVASIAMIGPSCLEADERAALARKLGIAFRPTKSGAYLLRNWEYLRVGGADADIALLHREMTDQLRAWATRPDAYAAAWEQDQIPLIMSLTCPAIAIAARDDLLFSALARIARIRPDIACVTLDSGANYEPDLAPDELARILMAHIAGAER